LNVNYGPGIVIIAIDVFGSAVPREFVKGCARLHDYRAIAICELFKRYVVSERSNIAACDNRSCRLDRCVMFVLDSAGVVLEAIDH
jgi:hypothetical protein